MKNNKIKAKSSFLLTMFACLQLISCDLSEVPKDFLFPGQFYKTESQVNAAIVGVYSVLYELHGPQDLFAFTEVGSDNVSADAYFIKTYTPPSMSINPGDNDISDFYKSAYKLVNQANAIVDEVSASTTLDQTFASVVVAEAKFLRAYTYFNMVRLFGDIVVFDNATASIAGLEMSRSPESKVYEKIISDLTEAEQNLNDAGLGAGRANKWAAKALLAKVFLTTGNYGGAISKTNEIIDSGQFELLAEYNKLFKHGNNNLNSEIMFAVQYGPTIRNSLTAFLTPGEVSNFSALHADFSLYDDSVYEPGDLRKDWTIYDSIQYKGNWVYPQGFHFLKFAEDYLIDLVPESESGAMDYPVLRYADVLLMNSEAIAMQEGSPVNAYEGINEVRSRSGLSPISGLSQQEFLDKLLHERRVELVLESQRWFDLKRYGKLNEVMNFFSGYQPYYSLYPIPSQALIANPALVQNEGY